MGRSRGIMQHVRVTPEEIRAYCAEWADVIFVREQIDGRWTSISLAELPEDRREWWVNDFVARGFIPVRIKRKGEINQ